MSKRLNKAFGKVLKEAREKAGLTQEQLAEESEYHATYISQLERGIKNPSLAAIFRLSRALGKKPSLIVKLVEDRYR